MLNAHSESIDKKQNQKDTDINQSVKTQEKAAVSSQSISSVKLYVRDMNNALKIREKDKRTQLKNLLKNKRISDKNYKNKKELIEKWVDVEKKQIIETHNILLQGWMKANEIVSHLKKNKNDVTRMIEERRSCLSPNSSNSNASIISFCRSNNSLSLLSKSSLSNVANANLNYTSDFDICNSLRRRSRPRHKH